jgi:hypothetical protein
MHTVHSKLDAQKDSRNDCALLPRRFGDSCIEFGFSIVEMMVAAFLLSVLGAISLRVIDQTNRGAKSVTISSSLPALKINIVENMSCQKTIGVKLPSQTPCDSATVYTMRSLSGTPLNIATSAGFQVRGRCIAGELIVEAKRSKKDASLTGTVDEGANQGFRDVFGKMSGFCKAYFISGDPLCMPGLVFLGVANDAPVCGKPPPPPPPPPPLPPAAGPPSSALGMGVGPGGKTIGMFTGSALHGAVIPLPTGYAAGQCVTLLSPEDTIPRKTSAGLRSLDVENTMLDGDNNVWRNKRYGGTVSYMQTGTRAAVCLYAFNPNCNVVHPNNLPGPGVPNPFGFAPRPKSECAPFFPGSQTTLSFYPGLCNYMTVCK